MIQCTSVTKGYASQPVLRGVDIVIEPGICALLGANGAGKSTLLRLLSGLEAPDGGSVRIGGFSFRDQAVEIRKNLGVVPEGLGLFESLTIFENLTAIGPIYGLSRAETESRASSLLKLLDLDQGLDIPARKGSFGMRKKTALAMALLYKPKVLLLDEPFEGIDPASAGDIERLLTQLSSDGVTILFTSHILSIVQRMATRVVVLHKGQVASDFIPSGTPGTVEEIYSGVVGNRPREVPDWLSS